MAGSRSNRGFAFCKHEARFVRGVLCAAALLVLAPLHGRCADSEWRVLIEPKFIRHEVALPISGSKRAELTPVLWKNGEIVFPKKSEFDALNVDMKTILQLARQRASDELKKLTPEFTRNRKKVIEFATLSSDSPLTASVVLSPDFLKMFAETLGPKVIVAIPNRFNVFVFPALASNYRDYAPMIADAYRASSYPVSMEAYEVSAEGLKTIGLYEEP
jgi:hypothetical protein